jgi:ubiquinone/menaquinone biosynthesis C-methylase UbiE
MSKEDQLPNLYLTTADYYDSDNQELGSADIDFYLNFAKVVDGPVLDLCCGTGRLAIPLALNGIEVTAVDFSRSMLEVLHNKLLQMTGSETLNINVVHGDMRNLSLGKTYKLIVIALRSFQVLQTSSEISETFTAIHRHLDSEGLLIIDLFKPLKDMKSLEGLDEEKVVTNSDGKILYTRRGINTKIDTLEKMLYCNFEYRPENCKNEGVVFKEQLQIKYYYKPEFRQILERNKFQVAACYGGFDYCDTNDPNATELLFICQANK